MKTIINTSIYIIVVLTTIVASYGQELELSDGQNYMMAVKAQQPFANVTELETAPQEQKIYNITYYDGLGRPMQQTAINASPNSKDIITHIKYDSYGRQTKQYLPYVASKTSGSYREVNVSHHINTYYKNKYTNDFPGITDMNQINAYSESVYEASPLNRVREQGAPGKAWKANASSDTDHTIKFDWGTNSINEVVHFEVTFENGDAKKPQLIKNAANYTAGKLFVTITKDENWQPGQTYPNDHTTKEYTDKLGRIVLKRTYNEGVEHDTYYVYDDFGNLTYVLPPKVTTDNGVSVSELAELCYQYHYDHRNRLIEKKIPGKGWEYIVYNKLDQPIMTQDANMRKENSGRAKDEWLFTKYDAYGRVAYTGKITEDKDRTALQNEVNAYTENLWVERANAASIGSVTMYYTDGGYPKVSTAEVLTINYYDDYGFLAHEDAVFNNPTIVYGEPVSNNTKSLSTGSKVKVLGTSYWTTTATYYDKNARPIYIVSSNKEFLETTDIIATKLDFVGKVLETTTTHTKGSYTTIKTVDTFIYDHIGRLLTQTQKINDQQEEQIIANTYDELGQLQSKTVGGGLQDVDYQYNIRGWLKGINDVNNPGADLFSFRLYYNDVATAYLDKALYNGNISQTYWRTANQDNALKAYTYSYDALNRITKAESGSGRYNLSGVTYDKMGNILTLQRTGAIVENINPAVGEHFGIMDNLGYTYDHGNKLKSVADTGSKDYGFKDGANTNDDFEYDANGNMIIDQNKGITGITYNHLNLPEIVTISNSEGAGNITYIYDATGAKLKKIAPSGSSFTETEYAGGYVYKNDQLEYFSIPEGYVTPNGSSYRYVYQYKDHLGNTRLSYTKNDNGSIEIVEERNYYPFGLTHLGYNNFVSSLGNSTAQLLSFSGKEEQNEISLGWLDFGARNYNSSIGRWMNIDNLSEDYIEWSPYNYALNNPIYFIDPDGNSATDVWSYNTDTNQLEWVSDVGGSEIQFVGITNNQGENLGLASVSGDDVYVAELENSVFVSSYDATSDIPEGYNSVSGYSYTGLDLKKRHELKGLGGVFWGLIQEAETNGQAVPIHSKTAVDQYVEQWGTNSAFWFGAKHYFMPEGGARGVAQRGYNALRKPGRSLEQALDGSKSSARGAVRNMFKSNISKSPAYRSISGKTSSKSGSISKSVSGGSSQTNASKIKNSWNQFLNANKGKYSGKNWIQRASRDYKALKSSTQQ
ncbi:DUF6443 domain-containing protein [Aquimarina mytili]|uniref:Type IV secretion protein Rhs n=1 Tax=Aquimarina mytili TaxID=874423 RepID=A0A937DB28_9FLAO|nr:DUF6443 domain-containing protein [Aquimarina mytili]MBL0685332.1 type IV secretion protein Rhs [Aquimarina mytili]